MLTLESHQSHATSQHHVLDPMTPQLIGCSFSLWRTHAALTGGDWWKGGWGIKLAETNTYQPHTNLEKELTLWIKDTCTDIQTSGPFPGIFVGSLGRKSKHCAEMNEKRLYVVHRTDTTFWPFGICTLPLWCSTLKVSYSVLYRVREGFFNLKVVCYSSYCT